MEYRRIRKKSVGLENDADGVQLESSADSLGLSFNIGAEIEEGNVEYKFKLSSADEDRLIHLSTQLNWRLNEGRNEAIYKIGVQDDGFAEGISGVDLKESIKTLSRMAKNVNAKIVSITREKGAIGIVATIHIRRCTVITTHTHHVSLRIAMLGDSNSGKTTLISVLTKGILDNGAGLARLQILRHYHEVNSGKTSSVSLIHKPNFVYIDLAGDMKYLNTTLTGLISHKPDLCLIVVDSETGLSPVVRDQVSLCVLLHFKMIFVETKIDVNRDGSDCLFYGLSEILKMTSESFELRKISFNSSSSSNSQNSNSNSNSIPYIPVSCVTGEGLSLLSVEIGRYSGQSNQHVHHHHNHHQNDHSPLFVQVTELYHVSGVDKVIGGIVLSGTVSVDSLVYIGPINDSSSSSSSSNLFIAVKVISISNGLHQISSAGQGSYISIGLDCIDMQVLVTESMDDVCLVPLLSGPPTSGLKRTTSLSNPDLSMIGYKNQLTHVTSSSGLMLSSSHAAHTMIKRFIGLVVILNNRDGVRVNGTPVMHIGNMSQTVKINAITPSSSVDVNDDSSVMCEFEFVHLAMVGIRLGDEFVLRDNRILAVGHVTELM